MIEGIDSMGINSNGFASVTKTKGSYTITSTDGVGTKLKLANHFKKYDTIGIDLVAMVVNDIMVHGGTPDIFLDYYATGVLDNDILTEILGGIKIGCDITGCTLVGGETAIMPLFYNYNNFDLAGFGVGYAEAEDLLPKQINSGDILIGLPSSGLHSNGFTLINKLKPEIEYLTPTKIYTECLDIRHLVNGFAHITGGGMDNISRVAENYFLNYWEFPPIFRKIQQSLNMTRLEMLKTFNCGFGMVAIVPQENVGKIKIKCTIIGEVL